MHATRLLPARYAIDKKALAMLMFFMLMPLFQRGFRLRHIDTDA